MSPLTEKRLLQLAILLGGAFSLFVATMSITRGVTILTSDALTSDAGPANINLDSHFRYLSGIFLGVLIAFYSCVPGIEAKGARFRLVGAFVVCGGLARLAGALAVGMPGIGHRYGLVMELIVTPLLLLWQARVARRLNVAGA